MPRGPTYKTTPPQGDEGNFMIIDHDDAAIAIARTGA